MAETANRYYRGCACNALEISARDSLALGGRIRAHLSGVHPVTALALPSAGKRGRNPDSMYAIHQRYPHSGTRVKTSINIPTLNEEKLLEGMLRQFSPDVVQRHNVEIIVS